MKKAPEAFRTISEVAEILETPAHVLRFWESKFYQIRPVKRAGGRRYYRPDDVALINGIKTLLQGREMTIRGVQRVLQENGVKHVAALGGPLPDWNPETVPADIADTSEPFIDDAELVETAAFLDEPEMLAADDLTGASLPFSVGSEAEMSGAAEPEPEPVADSMLLDITEETEAVAEPGEGAEADADWPVSRTVMDPAPAEETAVAAESGLEALGADDVPLHPSDTLQDPVTPDPEAPDPAAPDDARPTPIVTLPETVMDSETLAPRTEAPLPVAPRTAPRAPLAPRLDAAVPGADSAEPSDRAQIARRLRSMSRGGLGPRRDRLDLLARRIDTLLERMSEASGAGRW